jgi:HPr kinase/phosphorylase
METALTVSRLFELHRERMRFSWIAGRAGEARELRADLSVDFPASLVGHLNLVRPSSVQVLGESECAYLRTLGDADLQHLLDQLFGGATACVIVADGLSPSPEVSERAESVSIPLLGSALPSQQVVSDLQYYLSRMYAKHVTVHGVFMEVTGVGVLLTGEPGLGKSELALELVSRGHRLIADDAPDFSLIAPDILEGACPPVLADFMEVRGLGVLNVRAMFGDSAIKLRKYLRLIIHLEPVSETQASAEHRLCGVRSTRSILGVDIPEVSLPVAPGHNMAVLVECTVQNYLLGTKGYNAARDLEERQNRIAGNPAT